MTTKGKSICNVLKTIRKQIADANEIKYEPRECHHKGDCRGTCPACEAEVKYLERELDNRRRLGRAVCLMGVSAGLAALTGCTNKNKPMSGREASPMVEGMMEQVDHPNTIDSSEHMVVGKVPVEVKPDTARFCTPDIKGEVEVRPHRYEADSVQTLGIFDDVEVVDTVDVETVPGTYEVVGEIVYPMPEYPGGFEALMEYLQKTVQYPPEAEDNSIEGRVVVKFIIEKDGSVSNPEVIRSVHPLLDREALRVVSAMPRWIPAKFNGESTHVVYSLPLTFALNQETDNEKKQ